MDGDNEGMHPRDLRSDELDRELDTALAKYAAVEPRAGLEERVLAHFRAEKTQVANHVWWRWSVAGVLAALFVGALILAWRLAEPSHPPVTKQAYDATSATKKLVTPVRSKGAGKESRGSGSKQARAVRQRRFLSVVAGAAQPKLEQFPSPQPLSEQEKFLQAYVAENPERAVLIARARTEALRQDQQELNAVPSSERDTDSERNHDTAER